MCERDPARLLCYVPCSLNIVYYVCIIIYHCLLRVRSALYHTARRYWFFLPVPRCATGSFRFTGSPRSTLVGSLILPTVPYLPPTTTATLVITATTGSYRSSTTYYHMVTYLRSLRSRLFYRSALCHCRIHALHLPVLYHHLYTTTFVWLDYVTVHAHMHALFLWFAFAFVAFGWLFYFCFCILVCCTSFSLRSFVALFGLLRFRLFWFFGYRDTHTHTFALYVYHVDLPHILYTLLLIYLPYFVILYVHTCGSLVALGYFAVRCCLHAFYPCRFIPRLVTVTFYYVFILRLRWLRFYVCSFVTFVTFGWLPHTVYGWILLICTFPVCCGLIAVTLPHTHTRYGWIPGRLITCLYAHLHVTLPLILVTCHHAFGYVTLIPVTFVLLPLHCRLWFPHSYWSATHLPACDNILFFSINEQTVS